MNSKDTKITLEELSQVYYLNKEIERDTIHREKIKSKAEKITASALGSQMSKNELSRIEKYAIEAAELDRIIEENIRRCTYEEKRIIKYINSIPDSRLRLIFKCRFIDCMTWNKIADILGGGNTDAGVRMTVNRYIKSCSICSIDM